MSPVASHKITLGQGGEQHDAADALLASFLVKRFEGKVAIVTGPVRASVGARPGVWPPRGIRRRARRHG